jgi:hypothetical protein
MEGVLAAFAQFDNDCRSDRTRAGMKAALELGRWTFLAPIGYLNAPRAMGKSLVADPERAPLVRRAFEEYATGRYTKEQLLKQARASGLTNRRGRPFTSQAIGVLRRNQLLCRHRERHRARRSRKARRLRTADLGSALLPRSSDLVGPCAEHSAAPASASRFPVVWLRPMRVLRARIDGKLVEGCSGSRFEMALREGAA